MMSFEIGDHVYKEICGITSKLQPKFTGPYKIIGKTKLGNYWLETGSGKRLKNSVNIERLKPCPEEGDDGVLYEVEKIMAHRMNGKGFEYQVKWQGYEETTWEPEENFEDDGLIKDYWKTVNETFVEDDESSSGGLVANVIGLGTKTVVASVAEWEKETVDHLKTRGSNPGRTRLFTGCTPVMTHPLSHGESW